MHFTQVPDLDELEAMRPKQGDTVIYQGEKFIVEECGMRFYIVHREDNPASKQWLKHAQVIRWVPPAPDQMEDHEWRIPLIKQQA